MRASVEEWRSLDEIGPTHLVSSFGRIESRVRKSPRILSEPRYGHYKQVIISGKRYMRHRLVAQAFLPNPRRLPLVNHKNGKKGDDRVENLEWATHVGNALHAHRTGLALPKWSPEWLGTSWLRAVLQAVYSGATAGEISISCGIPNVTAVQYTLNCCAHWASAKSRGDSAAMTAAGKALRAAEIPFSDGRRAEAEKRNAQLMNYLGRGA